MAMPFYKVQAGQEVITTHGTAVPATAKWMAYKLYPKVGDLAWEQPEEDRGSLIGAFWAYAPAQVAEMGDLEGPATFEDILYPLLMGIKGGVTPTTPNTAQPTVKLWTFTPNLTIAQGPNNPDSFTVEWGDDVQAWESEYVIATGLKLSGKYDEAWKVSASLVGRRHTADAFTGSLADRTVQACLFNLSKLYMDDSGASIGATQIVSAFSEFDWSLPGHFDVVPTGDGALYFTLHSEQKLKPELNLILVLDATTKALITTKYKAGTVQLIRIKGIGTVIGGGLTNFIQLDGAYRIMDVEKLGELKGLTIARLKLAGENDSGYAKLFEIAVQNTIATLP